MVQMPGRPEMKPRFDLCLSKVLESEGGYSNDTFDRGGATNSGITQLVYDDWRVRRGFGRQPVMGISADEVRQIYFDLYWSPGKCAVMPAPLDYVHFDGCVNHGVGQAAKFLQRALGVKPDGGIGPQTLAALAEEQAAGRIDELCSDILKQRDEFYHRITERDTNQNKFLKGWLNRLEHVRETVLA